MKSEQTKQKLARIEQQNAARVERENAEPEQHADSSGPGCSVTSYLMPNVILQDVEDTRVALQRETGRKTVYNASNIVRAAMFHFVRLEMNEQIQIVETFEKAGIRVSSK